MTAQLTGSPASAFYYADKLFTPLTTTLIYSISTVLFPKFSQEYTSGGGAAYRKYIWGVLRSTLLPILPISAVLAAFGTPIVRVAAGGQSGQEALAQGEEGDAAGLPQEQDGHHQSAQGNGRRRKLMLVVKCVGLGAAAAVVYALLLLLLRQEPAGAQEPVQAPVARQDAGVHQQGDEGPLHGVVGLGAAAAVVYALLLLLLRQEDFAALLERWRKPKKNGRTGRPWRSAPADNRRSAPGSRT